MGLFLAIAGIIDSNESDVTNALASYATSLNGTFRAGATPADSDTLTIATNGNNLSILFPDEFFEWQDACEFLSRKLQKSVFSFHIHDGDLWMYDLYRNGERLDGFNPIPDYWDEDISDEERGAYKGNAAIVCQCVPGLREEEIERYLVTWDLDDDDPAKAYPTDENPIGLDWQLLDFIKKLGFVYPLDDSGKAAGKTHLFKIPRKRN
jgi:hypothetical protein